METWAVQDSRAAYVAAGDAEYGTFKDSLRAPVHRWFKYPAGYSYRFVEAKILQYGLNSEHWILDPFVGCGTTSVEAKRHGVNSIGVEAHPFVYWVARTKTDWTVGVQEIASAYHAVMAKAEAILASEGVSIEDLPELVRKCYSPGNLLKLLAIRNAIRDEVLSDRVRAFLDLALTDTLRNASKAATGWPYIAPNKIHERAVEKDAVAEFRLQVRRMIDDLQFMQMFYGQKGVQCILIHGDARQRHSAIRPGSIDLAITSPPYLNNYDYADRTRLETYFFGWFKTWGEITQQVREQLIMSATTQVRREAFGAHGGLSPEVEAANPEVFKELVAKIGELSERRMEKGGKKSYDFMVAGYFNDMLTVLQRVFEALKRGSDFVLVLGDSAPYGVYVPTHEYLARLALGLGFSSWTVEELRTRGEKWRENPQRHRVKLKEVVLTLTK